MPIIDKEECFALKGGTAINLFYRPFPRLSVDIDLLYLPMDDRQTAWDNILAALNNVDDSQYKNSLHIMILGTSGTQASPFQGHPASKIDENSSLLKMLKPITSAAQGDQWQCYDMIPLRNALEQEKITLSDSKLSRVIKGYDLLVVIPKVTASKIAEN